MSVLPVRVDLRPRHRRLVRPDTCGAIRKVALRGIAEAIGHDRLESFGPRPVLEDRSGHHGKCLLVGGPGETAEMAKVEAGPKRSSESLRTFRGQWWLPAEPTKRVGGTLDFVAGEGGSLEIHGGLAGEEAPPWPIVIFGDAGGKLVTITDAHYRGHTIRGLPPDRRISREEWRCFEVLIDHHAEEGGDARFDSFALGTSGLPAWVGKPSPDMQHGDGGQISIKVDIPAPLSVEIDGVGTVMLSWGEGYQHSGNSISLDVTPRLEFRPLEPTTTQDAWLSFVTPTLFFLTLASGTADRISSLHVGLDDSEEHPYGLYAEMLVARWADELPRSNEARYWEQLLPFSAVEPRFDDLLRNWFDLYATTRDSLLDFFAESFTPFMFAEESFVRVVRSMESWHRAEIGGTYMPAERFEALLHKLRQSLDEEEWAFADMRLAHGNERTLRQRLEELVGLAGQPVQELLARYKAFPQRVVRTRNSLAHEGRLGDAFTEEELFWAQKTLEHVFRSVLLRRLGLAEPEVEEAVRRSAEWRWLSDANNRLAR